MPEEENGNMIWSEMNRIASIYCVIDAWMDVDHAL